MHPDSTPSRTTLLDAVIASADRSAHSPLYDWLYAHHDALTERLARPRWAALAELLANREIMDGRGHAPSGETVRKTWWKVRRTIAAERRVQQDQIAATRNTATPCRATMAGPSPASEAARSGPEMTNPPTHAGTTVVQTAAPGSGAHGTWPDAAIYRNTDPPRPALQAVKKPAPSSPGAAPRAPAPPRAGAGSTRPKRVAPTAQPATAHGLWYTVRQFASRVFT